MTNTIKILFGLTSLILLTSLSTNKSDFRKYTIESGVLTYELTHLLTNEKIEQRVYFTKYGANEFFEFTDKTNPKHFPILKQDSVQYLFLSDSLAIKDERTFDNIFEKCVFDRNSNLYFPDFEFRQISDTVYMGRECEVYEFNINSTGREGTAIVWSKIPLNIKSTVQGLTENVVVTDIDTISQTPIDKTRLRDYVDYE